MEPSLFENVVTLVIGLAWPATVLVLVIAYRSTLKRVFEAIEHRIASDPKVNAWGLSFESGTAALPPASASSQAHPATSEALARTLSLSSGTNVLIALGEISKDDDQSAVIGSGDALGLALVQAALLRVQGTGVTSMVVRKSRDSTSELLRRYAHAICIGGPRANRLTAAVMSAAYLTFEFRSGGIYDKTEHKLHTVSFRDEGMSGTDWAILAITGNPLNATGRAVVLAGYSGYGTNAAAAVFAKLDEFPELQQLEPTEALIKVDIADGVVGSPIVVSVRTMPTVSAVE